MAHWAWAASSRAAPATTERNAQAIERSTQAIELAEAHGLTGEPVIAVAYLTLGTVRIWQLRLEEAETLLDRAERALRVETEPAAGLMLWQARGILERARGRDGEALAAFQAAERPARLLVTAHPRPVPARAYMLLTLARLGQAESAERTFAELGEQQQDQGVMRIAAAALRLAGSDPQAAAGVLVPVLDGSAPVPDIAWLSQAFLLEAIARDTLDDQAAAGRALERALDLAEPDGILLPFLLYPAPELLERHARQHTAHASLLADIRSLLAGQTPAAPSAATRPPLEPLSDSEIRVLRYLPTNLTAPDIASELYVSPNTVKTHVRHLYEKLGTHQRRETVIRARALGLLAPAGRR